MSVRTAATANLKNLAEAFGTEWALTNVVSEVLDLAKSSNYLRRVTMLDAIGPEITADLHSLAALIRMKRAANRPKDRKVLPRLLAALRAQEEVER